MANKVLLVDDESHVTGALKRALRQEPYEILTANSGKEALDIMAVEEIDVVISDEKMPGMSGTDFLALVSRRYPETIRIILTGQASLEAAMRAINEGEVYRFFTKPWNHLDLVTTIRQAIQQKDLITQNRLLSDKVKKQSLVLQELEEEHPGITRVERDSSGAAIIDDIDDMEKYMKSLLTGKDQ